MDIGFIVRHPLFLITFILAIPAWIIAFAAQCAAEAKYGESIHPTLPFFLAHIDRYC
jgi:hypothetical protein